MIKHLFFIVSIFFSVVLFSQNENFVLKHFDTRNGLAGEEVTGLTQDKKGFIWIATSNGLQRFDGENFVTYRHKENDTASLSYDELFYPVLVDSNKLWLKSPDSYINIFNIKNLKTTKIGAQNDWGSDSDKAFIFYCKDELENMWLCSHTALFQYNNLTKQIKKIATFPAGIYCQFHGEMVRDPVTGIFWIGLPHGLMEYDPVKDVFYYFNNNPDSNPLFKIQSPPYDILIDSKRNVWVSTWRNELFRYNINTHDFKQFNVPKILTDGSSAKVNSMVRGIVEDKQSNIWIGIDKGTIFRYDNLSDSFVVSIPQLYDRTYMNKTDVQSMFYDREGNIWVATSFGVFSFNPDKQKIFSVENNSFRQFSFPARQVNAFTETSNGQVWVASRDGAGISVFDEKMKLIKRMLQVDNVMHKDLAGIWIWAFCEDNNKKLWMSSDNELISYDLLSNRFSVLKIPEMDGVPYSIVKDNTGNLWISAGRSIIQLNPQTLSYTTFSGLCENFKIKDFEIRDMFIDKNNNFWVGAIGGLFLFDMNKHQFSEFYFNNANDNHSLYSNEVICVNSFNDSMLLIGTGKGVNVFNTHTKKFAHIINKDGTASNVIQGIMRDNNANIFTATFSGLYKINAGTKSFTHYDYNDGISHNEFYTRIYKLHDGRMLAGGLNSFIYFNPTDLKETFTPPDVEFTGFKIFDEQKNIESSNDSASSVHLNYNQNFITIQYASLYFNAPSKIRYYYKLEGVDEKWVNAGNARYASYTNLNNGNYIFEVKCINDDGIVCKNITTINIIIAPPFYKTWWFVLLCICVVSAAVYSVYMYRMRNRKALALVRQHIASDLHDDIGSTLNSISVYSAVADQQLQNDNEKVKNILLKMGDASRNMIDQMNDIVWAINPQNDDFENILKRMQYFAGELLSAKNILLQFDVDQKMRNTKLAMKKRKNFYLIYKEVINNAFKYSDSKNVNVSIAEKDSYIIMIITDNGKGFDTVKNGLGGNGLKNMKLRSEEIGAHLEIDSWIGKGTRVCLKMKV